MAPRNIVILFVVLVVVTALLLVFLFSLGENEPEQEKKPHAEVVKGQGTLRNGVYSHLDKLCKDVNSLDKLQIAIYFLMQSWLKVCDIFPDTIIWAPLKLMKKKIHEAADKKIHEFHKQDERTVEDCIIEYHNTEIAGTKDDFHQMIFEMVLQAYVNAFGGEVDETGEFLKMETINCNKTASCQYSFKKPTNSSQLLEKILKKSPDETDVEVKERKCVQMFHYMYVWNTKIKHPESFDWVYFFLFRGLQTSLNFTAEQVKEHLHCFSEKMVLMEEAMTTKNDTKDPFMLTFLQERDLEIEVLEDELEYALETEEQYLENRLGVQNVLAEIVINTYMKVFNIKPEDGKFTLISITGKSFEVEIPPMDNISLL